MSEYIKPTSDIFVKFLFGTEKNKRLLISFINAVLEDSDLPTITSVELKNPFNIKEFITDKESILDLKAVDEKGRYYDIEVQTSGTDHYRNRSLYYWSKLYSSQLENSKFYTELTPAICINLLDFNLFGEKTPLHSCFILREKNNPELVLTDHLIIHFLELHKLDKHISNSKLKHWIQYFKYEGGLEDMTTLLESDPDIKEAHKVYKEFSQNSEYRELYEARQKWLRDYEGRLDYEQKKAREEGKQEGKQEGRLETALELLKMGMSIDVVVKATGLLHEIVEELSKKS